MAYNLIVTDEMDKLLENCVNYILRKFIRHKSVNKVNRRITFCMGENKRYVSRR